MVGLRRVFTTFTTSGNAADPQKKPLACRNKSTLLLLLLLLFLLFLSAFPSPFNFSVNQLA